jgi:hypothetical protein
MSDAFSETNIYKTVKVNLDELARILGNPIDLNLELRGSGDVFGIAYLESMVNEDDLKTNLLAPLIQSIPERNLSLDKIAANLPETGAQQVTDLETAASHLLTGRTVIFLKDENQALSFKTPGWAKHQPKEPTAEIAIRGPREGFTETLSENIGMIRRWVQDRRLRADSLEVGRRTKTKIALLYLEDVAQPRLIKEVKRRVTAIDIDGIVESGYIELLIKDRRASLFPMTQNTERTDKVTAAILEGRAALLVDKSPSAILVPATVNELYQSADDYYIDFWLASFSRLIRLFGNILSVGLPGLYVAFAAVNPELLPTQFALTLASSRAHAPLPLVAEVFILEIAVAIFYEAALRLPVNLSQSVGIVAGVTLGLMGVLSGMVSPFTVIVVAITALASYTGPNYSVGLVWRVLKYIMLLAASVLGFFGLTIAGVLIIGHMADLKSFGVSYLAPWAPLEWPELKDTALRAPFWSRWRRPKTYRPQDSLRSGGTKREDDEAD